VVNNGPVKIEAAPFGRPLVVGTLAPPASVGDAVEGRVAGGVRTWGCEAEVDRAAQRSAVTSAIAHKGVTSSC